MPLRDFGTYGIIFMTMCVYYFRFSVILDGQFSSLNIIQNWIAVSFKQNPKLPQKITSFLSLLQTYEQLHLV
jgi:hypothetical protein